MTGIFQPVTSSDLLNTRTRRLADKVAAIWDVCVAKEADYMNRRNVLLVETGSWLEQRSYTDATGHYLKFRLNPSFCHLAPVKESGRKVLQAFQDLFPGAKEVKIANEAALYDGSEETVTVIVVTYIHSIGD